MYIIRIKIDWLVYGYILFASIASVVIFPVILEPLDNDVFYHMVVARDMVENNRLIAKEIWFDSPAGLRQFRYPPIFHWLLVLLSLDGTIDFEKIAVVLQIIFFPFALVSSYILVSHIRDKQTGLVAIILLTLYFPFFGRTHMAIPEALQHSLIPLTFLFYLKNKVKLAGFMMSIMLATHVFDAIFVLFTILCHWFLYRRATFKVLFFLLLSLPGIIFQVYGVYGFLALNSIKSMSSVYDFARSPSYNYLGMILGIACPSIMLTLGVWSLKKDTLSKDSILLVIWFFFLMLIFLKLSHRFPAYAGLPLAFFAATGIRKVLEKRSPHYQYYLSIIAGLVIANIYWSYQLFPHVSDFYKPGVDKKEREALLWIRKNLPSKEVIQVNQRRSCYRIVYFTRHNSTETAGKAKYLYSVLPDEPSGEWSVLKIYGKHKIYMRSSKGFADGVGN